MAKPRDIPAAVEEELIDDRLVDAAAITVRGINGEVALKGTVPSYPQYLEAAAAARRVGGVTKVRNHLKVVLPPEHCRNDALLTAAANNALAASHVAPGRVEASAKNGCITLRGELKYRSQCAAAESAIRGLTGVRDIQDEIELIFDVDQAEVSRLVQKALRGHPVPPDNSHVAVNASGNTVTLIGNVRTEPQRDAVVDAAWRGHGVMAVITEVEVTG